MTKLHVQSQSALKDLERKDGCPRKWEGLWISRSIERPSPSQAQEYGLYFETMCIGSGAYGAEVNDLPRLKSGGKSADQVRLDKQAETFRRYFDPEDEIFLGFRILDTQVVVGNGERQGVIDILAEDSDGTVCHIDLKATSDVKNSNGNYGWGSPERMDFIQQVLYSRLYNSGKDVVRVFLLVFDWSTSLGKKLIELDITESAIEDCWNRFSSADELINEYNEDYWPTLPSKKECSDCPLQCSDRFNELEIEKVTLVI